MTAGLNEVLCPTMSSGFYFSRRRPNGPEVTTITANKNKGEIAYENEDETLFEHPLEHPAQPRADAWPDAGDEFDGAGGGQRQHLHPANPLDAERQRGGLE